MTVVPRGRSLGPTRVERSRDVGIFIASSSVSLEATLVRDTLGRVRDGNFGDGVAVFSAPDIARVTVRDTRIESSARAGLVSFGAFASLGTTAIGCAAFALEGEPYGGRPFELEDRGGNSCGCPASEVPCVAVSAGLEPPQPIEANE